MQKIIFKLPYQEEFFTLETSPLSSEIQFHSFDNSQEIQLKGNIVSISAAEIKNLPLLQTDKFSCYNGNTISKEEYLQQLSKTIEAIHQYQLPKLVLSRQKWLAENQLHLGETFLRLAQDYANAFVYLMISDQTAWIGATPEILGKYNTESETFTTMSLAGTLPLDEEWTHKEIEEQKPVSQYISSILKKYNDVQVSDIYDHISGNIKHLRNDFTTHITLQELATVIADLHPTPAVCGVPKELCQKLIQQIEQHDRKYYSGYIRLAMGSDIYYFVNLRCAEIFSNGILLYAGGGITAESNPEKEWTETELKSDAIRSRLCLLS
ncbi:chorismate-binding protein [Elizabethkingia sp. JS20170427COW]|uniref:chorismate-binding protein n=1 Tax=Elizabethkingia sp. JS20170427COW TaxID=2583851 RepID=UPI001110DAE1|nr:chorismate-binding protein [Elizabethkingia sp. JS20170427COW]QCX53938.1 hypothetical protein FGE20_09435 [Elizabethkingia sp. JS20170427COW]